ncbi:MULTISPECIES: hypothetical protein [Helicobacter]|uniref:hypothetical protein n=1 Tax=Helicobacter TaxID=209 RepID=UPI0023F0A68E|nr:MULTISPECIES: hypothetical protein [Helicobacter]
MAKVTLNFGDVKFHIKEFQKVYILEGCSLVFYEPYHLQAKGKSDGEEFENEDGKIRREREITKKDFQKRLEKIDKKQERLEQRRGVLFKCNAEGNDEINSLFSNNIDDLERAYNEKSKNPPKRSANKFKDYDIFYDVYTNQDNIKNYIEKFEVENGIVTIPKSFLQECFSDNEKWCIIPMNKQKIKSLSKWVKCK